MAKVLLFHHILGLTPGLVAFKRRLEALNIEVEMPDLFDGNVFETVDDGLFFVEQNQEAIGVVTGEIATASSNFDAVIGVSFGAVAASQVCHLVPGRFREIIFVSAFVPPEVSRFDESRPKVSVIASLDDPFFSDEDYAAFIRYQETFPDSSLTLFAGDSHFFIDDSHKEYSAALTDITLDRFQKVLSRQSGDDLMVSHLIWSGDGDSIEVVETSINDPRIVYCTQRYRQELFTQFGIDPITDEEWKLFCEVGGGRCFLAQEGDRPLGTVTLSDTDATFFEVKRLWVDKSARGHNLGKMLMTRVEEVAKAMGGRRLLLDTNEGLVAAVGLYRSMGYVETAPYNSNSRAQLWMSKVIE